MHSITAVYGGEHWNRKLKLAVTDRGEDRGAHAMMHVLSTTVKGELSMDTDIPGVLSSSTW